MNALAPATDFHAPVAGPQPHRFTLDDVIVMREAGVIHPDARIELLDGEIIDMASEGELHASFVIMLNEAMVAAFLGTAFKVAPGTRLSLAPKDAPVPDFYIIDASAPLINTPTRSIKLVVEVSDTSLSQDMGRKALKYGAYAIPEYWIVDVRREVTHVHTAPLSEGYAERTAIKFDAPLSPARLADLKLIIADLPRLNLEPPA